MVVIQCSEDEARRLVVEYMSYGTVLGYAVDRFALIQNDPTGVRILVKLWDETRILFATNFDSGELQIVLTAR